MIDTYLKSKSLPALEELSGFVTNMIRPTKGSVAAVNELGEAIPQRGDPDYWYACVRAPFSVQPYGDLAACSADEGVAVCGVWA